MPDAWRAVAGGTEHCGAFDAVDDAALSESCGQAGADAGVALMRGLTNGEQNEQPQSIDDILRKRMVEFIQAASGSTLAKLSLLMAKLQDEDTIDIKLLPAI